MKNILIFGGSFDPPHKGHINTLLAVQNHFNFAYPIILPCKTPVLKKNTTASCEQRTTMLQLAFESYPAFQIDLREIQRNTASYMIDTLLSFREEWGENIPITLLLGMDAFLQLPSWHHWEQILQCCNLLVMTRQHTTEIIIPNQLNILLNKCETFDKTDLLLQPCGKIYRYNAGEYLISSSLIREKLIKNQDVEEYLTPQVYQYIKKEKLYLGT